MNEYRARRDIEYPEFWRIEMKGIFGWRTIRAALGKERAQYMLKMLVEIY